ncbi:hypothetical protein [Pedobacter sp. UYP1]|uniref:hypothetical protein n=1 Tax=Pedobacter sp. UYP1 TaxID=1756396 RepID=UPI003396C729
MKKILQISSISLLAIGLVFGRYIGRWLVNIFDNPDTTINDGRLHLDEYLSKCDTVSLNIKKYTDSISYFEVKAKFNPSSADNTAFAYKNEITFYSDSLHKYFSIFYFFSNPELHHLFGFYYTSAIKNPGGDIIATVNRLDLNDGSYGTKEKPVPIIYFQLKKEELNTFYSMAKGNNKGDFNGSEADFKKYILNSNAGYYLSYVKSKQDFEKMFGKEKQVK